MTDPRIGGRSLGKKKGRGYLARLGPAPAPIQNWGSQGFPHFVWVLNHQRRSWHPTSPPQGFHLLHLIGRPEHPGAAGPPAAMLNAHTLGARCPVPPPPRSQGGGHGTSWVSFPAPVSSAMVYSHISWNRCANRTLATCREGDHGRTTVKERWR